MKTIIITGANSGLGFETAKKVATNHDYEIILACRNAERAAKAKEQIVLETGNEHIEAMPLDTSSMVSVRAFTDAWIAAGRKIDALLNNAGISPMGNTGMTEDGFEIVFATNYLGHFLLTQLLLPQMAEEGSIWNVTSDMHNPPGGITWTGVEALAHPQENDRRKYSYSKLCMIYWTHELARRLKESGSQVTVNSFNPGYMADTNFSKGGSKAQELMIKTTMPNRYSTLERSSDALATLITGDSYKHFSGVYFDRSVSTAKSSELSYDRANAQEVWNASLKYCGLD